MSSTDSTGSNPEIITELPAEKMPVRGGLRVNAYAVLVDCVERGVAFGWNHAHKHVADPSVDAIQQHIVDDVLNSVAEYFSFDTEE